MINYQRLMKRLVLTSLAMVLGFGLVSTSTFAYSKLRIGFGVGPTTLDPHVGTAGSDHNYIKQMFDTLVEIDPAGNPIPSLAVRWENKGLKVWTFYLRKGVKFHDGTPFNAQAVKFNIERLQDPATKSRVRGIAMSITKMRVINDLTIELTLKAPNVDFPIVLQDRPGMIASPTAIKKYGKEFSSNPVGTGAFRFKKWRTGDSVIMTKNQDYWNKSRVHIDEVEFKIVPDKSVAIMSLQGRKIDMLIAVPPERVKQLESSRKFNMYKKPALGFTAVYLTQIQSPPFDNKLVRQALAHSIDKIAISRALFFGLANEAITMVPPNHWAFTDNIPIYTRANPAKAKELLARAGYPNGLKMEMKTIPAFPYDKIAQIVKQQAGAAGFDIQIETMGTGQLIQGAVTHKFQSIALGWSGRTSTDATFQALVHSSGAYNNKNFINAEVDKYIEAARNTEDQDERKAAYAKVQKIVAEEVGLIPIFHMPLFVATQKKVSGFQIYLDLKVRLIDTKIN